MWVWRRPLHLGRNTAGRTTVRKQCALTAVIMEPATIARAIDCTARVSVRRLRMRGRTNMKLITVAGRTPPQRRRANLAHALVPAGQISGIVWRSIQPSVGHERFHQLLCRNAPLAERLSSLFVGYWDFTRPSRRFPTGNTGSHPPRTAQIYR